MYGLTNTAVVPMRAAPDERSEMVSQLLWGETFAITDQNDDWHCICNDFDGYRGWVNKHAVHTFCNDEDYQNVVRQPFYVCTQLCCATHSITNERVLIPHGAVLYGYNTASQSFVLNKQIYHLNFPLPTMPANKQKGVIQAAYAFLNAPYLWGGRTALGIDCSGFTQLIFFINGISIPRDACQQAEIGDAVQCAENNCAAALAFFGNTEAKITHVGIILDSTKIIHASGKVRIDKWDSEGIYNENEQRYTHKLRCIRQIIV
jgi:cell wall-associated NlpC family hydrolase